MFRIEMLPAEQGDALFIEYGSASQPAPRPDRRRRAQDLRPRQGAHRRAAGEQAPFRPADRHARRLRSHRRHPEAPRRPSLGVTFDDVWFNGWRHLQPDRLGPVEGEIFSAQLDKREWDWNAAFDEKAVVVRPRGRLPKRELPGGMTLTLLSPTVHRLEVLRDEWKKVVEEARLEAGVQDENLAEAARRKGSRICSATGSTSRSSPTRSCCRTRRRRTAARSRCSPSSYGDEELPAHRRRPSGRLRGGAQAPVQGPKEVNASPSPRSRSLTTAAGSTSRPARST